MEAIPRRNKPAASIVKQKLDSILEIWAERTVKLVPSANKVGTRELVNNLTEVLSALINYVSASPEDENEQTNREKIVEVVRKHGRNRAQIPGYTLEDVIKEYQILRKAIFESVESEVSISIEERDRLIDSVDFGITEALSEFAHLRVLLEARLEKAQVAQKDAETKRDEIQFEVDRLQMERVYREQFVLLMSHDLRLPLATALSSAQFIQRQAENIDLTRTMSTRIIKQLGRVDRMIQDILDVSKIRMGESLPLQISLFDFSLLLKTTVQDFALVYGPGRFQIESLKTVVGHWSKGDIRRLLENLLVNAIKFGTQDRPVKIRVIDTGDRIKLSVHNEGQAIISEKLNKLFQSNNYERFDLITSKTGWGIGLILIKGICEAHGGNIVVKSEKGQGTTFIVTLPKDARSVH